MYVPPNFKNDDLTDIHSFIDANAFGLLLTTSGAEIHDTHTPFVWCKKKNHLLGHIARANPQWKSWQRTTRAKVIFSGAHAYISPNYYASEFNVPTWNYTAVSVSGCLSIIEDETEILGFLDTLAKNNERGPSAWALDRDDPRYMKLLPGIVVFSVSMDQVEASFKLNQNKTEEDQRSVIQSLQKTGRPFDGEIAALMASNVSEKNKTR